MIVPWEVAISFIAALLAAGRGLTKWQISTRPMRLLTVFLLYSTMSNIASIALATRNVQNLFLFHIYALFTYSAMALVFSYWHKDKLRQYIRLSIPVYLTFYLLLLIIGYEDINKQASLGLSVMSVLITIVSLYTLLFILQDSTISTHRDERFWVSIATLFIFSINAVIYSGIRSEITIDIWIIHNIFNAIGYLCYFGGYQWTRTHTI